MKLPPLLGTAPTSEALGICASLPVPSRVATPLAAPFSVLGINTLVSAGGPVPLRALRPLGAYFALLSLGIPKSKRLPCYHSPVL